ncbi:hypothetical protein B0H11DRAFT_2214798 [Mycena galericulata]|nr:hypothetical protein B0H11DRAFT_2214798 [Mycena galericulata]
MPVLPQRTLRSGREFGAFDLAVGAAIEPAEYFDVAKCLAGSIADKDEPAEIAPVPSFWVNPTLPAVSVPNVAPKAAPASALKRGSRRRRNEKRARDAAVVGVSSSSKSVAQKHRDSALRHAVHLDFDAADLPHSKPAWIGLRSAEDEHADGMGGRAYTREEIEALTGARGLRYLNWLGRLSLPIVDSKGRIIAVLGGMPKDLAGWKRVTNRATELLAQRVNEGSFSTDQLHHRRAQNPYPSVSRGISHGGGQTEPGELCNNEANTRLTDQLLREKCFQRLAGFANCLFAVFAPLLFAFYTAQMVLLTSWRPSLRWNFARSVFAACTFNFGPHAITVPHLDFGNLAWGWCAITALGDFDPDYGGHLILWDLKLVIRFPPGSTVLIPSAIVRHSNVPVREHERRYSFTQYTAGGLFRWVRNGFKTEEAFENTATREEKATRAAEEARRWEEGVAMYSNLRS